MHGGVEPAGLKIETDRRGGRLSKDVLPIDGELESTEPTATSDQAEGLARWMEFNRRRQRS